MDDEMRKDINNFLDNDVVKNKMLYMFYETDTTNNEHGILFVITDDKIITSDVISGEGDIVDIEREVDYRDFVKYKKHGSFHTHPYNKDKKFHGAIPSDMDIRYSILYDEYFSITGTITENNEYIIYVIPTEVIKESIIEVTKYLISINEPAAKADAAREIIGSMIYHPETWEKYMIIKQLN